MSGSQKPLEPVAPDGMELLFFYRCPHCLRHVPLGNPVEPRNVRCDGCGKQFPIIGGAVIAILAGMVITKFRKKKDPIEPGSK